MIKFNQTISMLECIKNANDVVKSNIKSSSTGTKDLVNFAQVKNRIAEYAVLFFVNNNFYQESVIKCEARAIHYGVSFGDVVKNKVGIAQIERKEHAELLVSARMLINLKVEREAESLDGLKVLKGLKATFSGLTNDYVMIVEISKQSDYFEVSLVDYQKHTSSELYFSSYYEALEYFNELKVKHNLKHVE